MYRILVATVATILILGGIAGVVELWHYDNGHIYDEDQE
jgi:hypothetical protein